MRRTINSEEAELDKKDKAWQRTNDKGLSDPSTLQKASASAHKHDSERNLEIVLS